MVVAWKAAGSRVGGVVLDVLKARHGVRKDPYQVGIGEYGENLMYG